MAGNKDSWDKMTSYCGQDLRVMEEVYLRLRPYVKNHPNLAIYEDFPGDAITRCPKCMSANIVKNGYQTSNISKFRKYRCSDCGNRSIRGATNLLRAEERREIMRPVT